LFSRQENLHQGFVRPEVLKQRPPSAKLKGGRKPRTLLDMKRGQAAIAASSSSAAESELETPPAAPLPAEFAVSLDTLLEANKKACDFQLARKWCGGLEGPGRFRGEARIST
jgi:hypothetical protein